VAFGGRRVVDAGGHANRDAGLRLGERYGPVLAGGGRSDTGAVVTGDDAVDGRTVTVVPATALPSPVTITATPPSRSSTVGSSAVLPSAVATAGTVTESTATAAATAGRFRVIASGATASRDKNRERRSGSSPGSRRSVTPSRRR